MTVEAPTQIPPIENYDPLGKFLKQTLRLSPLSFGLFILVANVVVDGWLGWRYEAFLTTVETPPGLLQDLTALVGDFVQIPIIAGLYLWTTKGATRLFQQLQNSRIFKSEAVLSDILNKSRPIFRSPHVFYIILVTSLSYALSQLSGHLGWVPWTTGGGYLDLYPPMSYARAPFWFLGFYTMLYGMFNIGVTVVTLRRLFRFKEIQLLPLHPDQCGGLESISQYSVNIAYGIGSLGLVISAATVNELQHGILLKAYPILAAIVAYIVLAPLFFFWPLGTAHQAMQDAKDAELLRLAQQFDSVYDRVKQEGIDQDSDYEKDMKRLEHLKRLYQIAQEFPVWPFDVNNLRRFLTVVTTPLIPALISVTSEAISKLFPL